MIVDENGSFRTQRQLPHMALISLSYTSTDLVLTYPDKGSLDVSLTPPKQKRIKCRLVENKTKQKNILILASTFK